MSIASMRECGLQTLLRGRVPATEDAVSAVLARLGRTLAGLHIPEEVRAAILLALGEILNNIVEHSVFDQIDPHIHLDLTRDSHRILVETMDHGRPLPPSLLSSPTLPALPDDPTDIDALPEGGFGWFIIHSLAQDMIYERNAGVNRLSFQFPI